MYYKVKLKLPRGFFGHEKVSKLSEAFGGHIDLTSFGFGASRYDITFEFYTKEERNDFIRGIKEVAPEVKILRTYSESKEGQESTEVEDVVRLY